MPSERMPISALLSEEFSDVEIWYEDDAVHIDVSALSAPDPLVATLRLIERPDVGGLIVFHNDREPVHLFAELLELGWAWRVETDRPGVFSMRIFREPTK